MNKENKEIEDYLQKIKFKSNIPLSEEDIRCSFETIKAKLTNSSELALPVPKTKRYQLFTSNSFRVACSVAILLVLSFASYLYYDSTSQILVSNSSHNVKEFLLPDGSKISLRANTSLSYNKNFTNHRNIKLNGEALFEVVKDKSHPFTVSTKFGSVTVLGTVFSVRSFAHESFTKAILKEGRVKFSDVQSNQSVVLHPGDEALLNEGASRITVQKVKNMNRSLSWQTKKFSFNNESLEIIMATLSDAFDTKIEIHSKSLKNQRYTLKFNHKEPLATILDVVTEVSKSSYRKDGNLIYLEKK